MSSKALHHAGSLLGYSCLGRKLRQMERPGKVFQCALVFKKPKDPQDILQMNGPLGRIALGDAHPMLQLFYRRNQRCTSQPVHTLDAQMCLASGFSC